MRGIDGPGITAEVRENADDDRRRLDSGDDAQAATALPAGLDVDGKHPPEALRRGHCPLPPANCVLAVLAICGGLGLWHDPGPVGARWREHAIISRQVCAGLGHQRDGRQEARSPNASS